MSNRYLKLMHSAPSSAGFEFLPARLKSLDADCAPLTRGDVFHVHWTQSVAQDAPTEDEAWERVATFSQLVDRLRKKGVFIVWTVHNRLPHTMRYLQPELVLSRFIADRADRIHILSAETPDAVHDLYLLPAEKVRHIPHPSYLGVHEATVTREQGRRLLGIAPDEPTVLFFGRMLPYKGLDTLLAAIDAIADRGMKTPTLILAGRAKTANDRTRIEQLLPTRSRVIAHFDFVDDSDIATWFAAADVTVFPFRAILNSGTVHLSATLGVPVVLPGEPHLVSQFGDEPWVHFYDPDDAESTLADILVEPDRTDHSASMKAFSERLAPDLISHQYLELLRELTTTSRASGQLRGRGTLGAIVERFRHR